MGSALRACVWQFCPFPVQESESSLRMAVKASLGRLTVPSLRIFFLPSFCFSSSFFSG